MAWVEYNKSLHLKLRTKSFAESLELANQVGALAEAARHHPDLELGWGYLNIHLTTHDQGCVTQLDRELAERIDQTLGLGT